MKKYFLTDSRGAGSPLAVPRQKVQLTGNVKEEFGVDIEAVSYRDLVKLLGETGGKNDTILIPEPLSVLEPLLKQRYPNVIIEQVPAEHELKRYFLTELSAIANMRTGYFQTEILDEHRVSEGYLDRARRKFGASTRFVAQRELYKLVKRRDKGKNVEIIVSPLVSVLLNDLRTDFPEALIWVYEDEKK